MASNIDINLNARTSDFESAMQRVNASFEKFAAKGTDAARALDNSFKQINSVGKASVNELQRAFNSLGIKTDFSMNVQREALVNAKHFFLRQFLEIRDGGKASADEIARAYAAMNAKIATLEANTPKAKSLAGAYDTLGIKSSLNIEAEKAKVIAAYEQIRTAGTASAKDVSRAHAALKAQLDQFDGKNPHAAHEHGMKALSLATIKMAAEMAIVYSVVNKVMGALGSMPKTAVDAIENFNTSVITNAAVITSMQGKVKDVGAAYRENKAYAEQLEKVLVRMDAETVASYSQLQKMNQAFIQQGVILDINSKKSIDAYRDIANAVAVIANTTPNPDQQFFQEIRGLMAGEQKAGNQLLAQLTAIDPKLKEHLELWKKQGTVIENLGPLLQGYAAATGDINSLWSTVKSTLATIRDEILRGGLSGAMGEIVLAMKDLAKYATENKEKIQAFLRDGFADAKAVAKFIWEWRDGFVALGKASIFLAITTGVASVIDKIKVLDATFKGTALFKMLSNPATAAVLLGAYGGYKAVSAASNNQKLASDAAVATQIANTTSGKSFGNGPAFSAGNMADFQNAFPLAGPELLALARNKGAATLVPDSLAGGSNIYKLKMDLEAIKKLQDGIVSVSLPKVKTGGVDEDDTKDVTDETFKKYSDAMDRLNKQINSNNPYMDKYDNKLEAINDEVERAVRETPQYEKSLRAAGEAIKDNIRLTEEIIKNQAFIDKGTNEIDTSLALSSFASTKRNALQFQKPQAPVFSLIGNEQHTGWAQPKPNDEQASINRDRVAGFMSGMSAKANFAESDNYGGRLDALAKEYEDRAKIIDEYAKKEIMTAEEVTASKIKSDELYAKQKKRLDEDTAKMAISSLGNSLSVIGETMMKGNKDQFEAGKKMAIAGATISMTLGAIQAYTSMTSIPYVGPVLGAIAAAAVVAAGTSNIARIESTHYEGRALGGPVRAGQTYIVNENRATQGPEYFTPGMSGTITPANKIGGSTTNVTQVLQISTGVADTVRAEIGRMLPMLRAQAVSAVMQAQRDGQFQAA